MSLLLAILLTLANVASADFEQSTDQAVSDFKTQTHSLPKGNGISAGSAAFLFGGPHVPGMHPEATVQHVTDWFKQHGASVTKIDGQYLHDCTHKVIIDPQASTLFINNYECYGDLHTSRDAYQFIRE